MFGKLRRPQKSCEISNSIPLRPLFVLARKQIHVLLLEQGEHGLMPGIRRPSIPNTELLEPNVYISKLKESTEM